MKNKELKVGLFTAFALVMLYFGFDFLKGRDFFSSTYKYYALYDNVDQLTKSNPVFVNGVTVGRVNRISILQNKQNKVLVELEIDSDIALGDSTKALLDSDFLGSKSIVLNIGKVVKPLEPNDTLLSEVTKEIMDVLTESAEPVADDLQTTIRKLNTVLDNLAQNSQSLDSLFTGLKGTPIRLNRTLDTLSKNVDELTTSLKTTTDNLNQTITDLRPTITNFNVFSDSLKRLELGKALSEAQKTIRNLNEIIAKLSKTDNTMGKLLNDDSVYVNLNKLLVSVDSLANHFDSNPKHFLAPLGKSQRKIEKARKKGQ